jgi:hypothetical protein
MSMDSTPPSKDTTWQTGLKGRSNNLLFTGDPFNWKKQTWAYGERLEEDLPIQWPPRTGKNSNTSLRKSRLQTYVDQTR